MDTLHLQVLGSVKKMQSSSPQPTAFKAAASDPDTLSFDHAMADIEHVTKWMEAAAKEVGSLERNGTWKEVSLLEAKTKVLPGTWVFRRKRSPDGEITSTRRATVFEAT